MLDSQAGVGPVHILREAVLPAAPFSPHISNRMWEIQIQMFSPWLRTRIWCLVPHLPGDWPDHQGIWGWGSPHMSIIKYWSIFWRRDWTLCLLGKSCNHQAIEPLTSSLYSNALYILDTSEKNPSFQFLVLLNMSSGSTPKNFRTAHLLSSFLEFTCLWWWWASMGSSKPWHGRILCEDLTRLTADQKIPGIFSLLLHVQSHPTHSSTDPQKPLPRTTLLWLSRNSSLWLKTGLQTINKIPLFTFHKKLIAYHHFIPSRKRLRQGRENLFERKWTHF